MRRDNERALKFEEIKKQYQTMKDIEYIEKRLLIISGMKSTCKLFFIERDASIVALTNYRNRLLKGLGITVDTYA